MNYKAIILPDTSQFKLDGRYGGSFKLLNDNVHYLQIEKAIFQTIKHDYSIELWFKINYYPIIVKKGTKEYQVHPFLFVIDQPSGELKLQCDKHFILLNGRQITRYQPNQ